VFLDCPVKMRAYPTVTTSSHRASPDLASYNSFERIGAYMAATNPYIGITTADAEL
jgi:hypothetical protein